MKERPILFSGEMVRAILNDSKTQTRRIVKVPNGRYIPPSPKADIPGWAQLVRGCPYGRPGDRLWVRETWQYAGGNTGIWYAATDAHADDGNSPVSRWKPSIHMPREASRIQLEITGVRVERLQDISNADCIAEGIAIHPNERVPRIGQAIDEPARRHGLISHYGAEYARLWQSINGPGSWDANPWVWVLGFKRISQ